MKLNLVVLVSLVLCAGCGINSGSGGAPQQVKAVGTGAASTSANTHYLSPTGNDSNDGVSESTPWLTTFHSGLNCGTDNIVALPSTAYTPSQFSYWGAVTCPSQNNVVWLQCATFDACTMTIPAGSNAVGMWINRSFWGVQGFEIDSLSKSVNGQTCFNVSPPSPSSPPIRNVIFANNVAINCPAASFGAGVAYQGQVSVDYVAYVGNVSYGAAASNQTCNSGFVVFTPVAADNQPGTHIYVAGNFSIASSNPANSNCIDGNGFIFDTFDGSTSNEPVPYAQQAVIENNIAVGNGGVGVRVVYSSSGSRAFSDIYLVNNTMWGNSAGTYQAGNSNCGEMQLLLSENVTGERNLAVTNQSGCYGVSANPNTAYSAINEDSTTSMSNNWGYAVPGGTSSRAYMQYSNHASSFQFDSSNPFGADPIFAEPVAPGAPGCAGSASVPLCMAQVIADFTPKIQAAQPYGYQLPSNQPAYNPLFPGWLCNVNLPTGLVTMGC